MPHFYHSKKSMSPRALWQCFKLWRAYRRPVTWADLRKAAHAAAYPHPDPHRKGQPDFHRPDPVGCALFDEVVRLAELGVK